MRGGRQHRADFLILLPLFFFLGTGNVIALREQECEDWEMAKCTDTIARDQNMQGKRKGTKVDIS